MYMYVPLLNISLCPCIPSEMGQWLLSFYNGNNSDTSESRSAKYTAIWHPEGIGARLNKKSFYSLLHILGMGFSQHFNPVNDCAAP